MIDWLLKLTEKDRSGSTALERLLRPTLALAALLLLMVAVSFGVKGEFAGVAASATAAIFCLLFVYLHRFQEIDVLGFKAKLLDQKVEEADRLIKRLNNLALAVAAPIYSMIGRHGRLDGSIPKDEQAELLSRIDGALLDAGISRADIEGYKRDVHFYNVVDLALPANEKLHTVLARYLEQRKKPIDSYRQPYNAEAQLVMRGIMESTAPIERFKRGWWDETVTQPFEQIPENIETRIRRVVTLTDSEREELLTLIGPELTAMKEYVGQCKAKRI